MIRLKREEKMNTTQQKFDQLLIEAIDEVLCSLGEPVKNQLYIILENDFSITKNELPQQIEEFSNFLFIIFGSSARHLEIKFMKTLYAKISNDQLLDHHSIASTDIDMTFLTYVKKMQESLVISRY